MSMDFEDGEVELRFDAGAVRDIYSWSDALSNAYAIDLNCVAYAEWAENGVLVLYLMHMPPSHSEVTLDGADARECWRRFIGLPDGLAQRGRR